MLRALVIGICATTLAGCATLGSRTPSGPSESDIRELRAAATRHEIEIERLRREVARLALVVDQQRSARAAPPPAATPSTTRPAAAPAPTVEISDLELPPPVSGRTPEPAAPTTPPPATVEPAEVGEAAQAIYDQGYTLYHQNRFVEAETAFQRFLQGWESSSLADNALFWIGACRLARGETDTALAAFREVVSRFPEGNKVPDALLKVAEISEREGDTQGALETYRKISTFYPDSIAAGLARERLERR